MEAPLITDWVQTAIAGAGVLMAAASLIWQWRTAKDRSKPDMDAKVWEKTDGVWHVWLNLTQAPRSQALWVRIEVLTRGAAAFDVSALPIRSDDRFMFVEAHRDFDHWNRVPSMRNLEVKVSHDDLPSPGPSAQLGLRVPAETSSARIRVTLRAVGIRRPLRIKKMVVSPTT